MVDWRHFHRSYEIYDPAAAKYVKEAADFDRRMPMNMRVGKLIVDEKYRDQSRKAFRLDASGLTEVRLLGKEGQDFKRYASTFERSRSTLCGNEGCDPVVDADGNVVAHLARARSFDLFFERFVGGGDANGDVIVDPFDADGDGRMDSFHSLNDALDQGCEIRMAATRKVKFRGHDARQVIAPDPAVAVEYVRDAALGQDSILLMVDPEGRVLYELERHSLDGVESHWMDPLMLIGIGQLGFKVVSGVIGFTLKRGASAGAKYILKRQAAKTLAKQAGRQTQRGASAAGQVPGRVTSRGMGAVGPGTGRAASSAEAAATQRMTARGMGAVGPRAGMPVPTPRIVGGRPVFSLNEMEHYLNSIMRGHPELVQLAKARQLTGDALRNELKAVIRTWENRTAQKFEMVPDGAVQRLTGEARNYATIRNGKFLIEEHAVRDLARFHKEVAHEFASHALGGRVLKIYIEGNERWHAQNILEMWVKEMGSFKWMRDFLGG